MSVLKQLTKKQIVYLSLIILWAVIVFAFSNQPAEISSKSSGGITEKIVKVVASSSKKEVPENTIDRIEKIVRKCAHFSLYLVGGFLIANFVNTTGVANRRLVAYAILFATMYACTDEIHQYFIEGRSCQPTDVLIDALGATTGTGIFMLAKKVSHKIKK